MRPSVVRSPRKLPSLCHSVCHWSQSLLGKWRLTHDPVRLAARHHFYPLSLPLRTNWMNSDTTVVWVWRTGHTHFLCKMVAIAASTFYGNNRGKWSFFQMLNFLVLIIKLFLQYKSLLQFSKILTLSKHNFYAVSFIVDSRTYYLLFLLSILQETEGWVRILLRNVEWESDFELSEAEVEDGQTVEQEGESSEEYSCVLKGVWAKWRHPQSVTLLCRTTPATTETGGPLITSNST